MPDLRTTIAPTLFAAGLTGAFCALFAGAMYLVAPQVALWKVMGLSALSGFLGSLFARFVLGRKK